MKYASMAATYLLGLVFLIFGLNGFFHFIPIPEMTGTAGTFMGAMVESKFMMVVKVFEVGIAAAILLNFKRPLMYVLLMPITVCILLFHLLMAGDPIMAIVLFALNALLLWENRASYSGMTD
jgi:putative oxidoreductase